MPEIQPKAARRKARNAANLIAALALLAFLLSMSAGVLPHGRDRDFIVLYTGAQLASDGIFSELHDPAVRLPREQAIYPDRTALIPFVRPHFYAAMLAPLAALSFENAFRVWIGLQLSLLGIFLWLIWREFGSDSLVFAAMFAPAVFGIAHGQDNLVMGVAVMAGLAALARGRGFQGGLWWSLVLIKFHLAPGLGLVLLVTRRWRALAGFAAGAAALAGVCLALAGPGGIALYYRMLTNPHTEGLYPGREKLPNLQGFASSLQVPDAVVYATLGAAVVALMIYGLRGAPQAPWWRSFALCLGGTLLLVPHVYLYDLTILLPAFIMSVREAHSPPVRWIALLLASPLLVIAVLALEPLQVLFVPALFLWLVFVSRDRAPALAAVPSGSSPPVPA